MHELQETTKQRMTKAFPFISTASMFVRFRESLSYIASGTLPLCLMSLALFCVGPVFGATYTVINTNDSGAGSLRQAILDANADAGADIIDFNLAYPATITMAGVNTEMNITEPLTITGPGASNLAIDGAGASRVLVNYSTNAAISGLTIRNGRHSYGAGFANVGTMTLTDSVVSGNNNIPNTTSYGGGIYNGGTLTIINSTVSGNTGYFGGGIHNRGPMTITNSRITGNNAYFSGGGIFSGFGDPARVVTMTDSVVSGNTAGSQGGGGITNRDGEFTITKSTVSGNSTSSGSASYYGGAGIYNIDRMIVNNSTVSGNTAGATGGAGIYNSTGTLTLNNSTITGNAAPGLPGGGIYVRSFFPSELNIKNTIVANNPSSGNCFLESGTLLNSYGHNLADDASCTVFSAPSDVIVAAGTAGLVPLANNGGPTETHALLADSPAIDQIPLADCSTVATPATQLTTDQTGTARPQGATCDIGAFEFPQGVNVPPTLAGLKYYDADADGEFDVGEEGIESWPIDFSVEGVPTTRSTTADGTFNQSFDPAEYTIAERASLDTHWIQTGNLLDQSSGSFLNADKTYTVLAETGGSYEGLNFGNLCVGPGGAPGGVGGIGYWTNKNGQSLIGAGDIALLVALNLRNANGTHFDPANAAAVKTWLKNATATNMAYMLSAQLAATELNVLNGFVSGTRLILAPGTSSANANGFATLDAVRDEGNTELGAHGMTKSPSSDRAYQEALKNALANANLNQTFVQGSAANCPAPF